MWRWCGYAGGPTPGTSAGPTLLLYESCAGRPALVVQRTTSATSLPDVRWWLALVASAALPSDPPVAPFFAPMTPNKLDLLGIAIGSLHKLIKP